MAKISFIGKSPVDDGRLSKNRETNRGRGLSLGSASCALAVVGGAPSVANYLDELREFDGEIWAVNGTWRYLKENGIESTFYSIDPHPTAILNMAKCATKAVLACCVDPAVFDAIDNVSLACIGEDEIQHFTTSAATAPMIAAKRGHKHVTFYGCDGSFQDGKTHVDKSVKQNLMWVECGGEEFVTSPQMLMQTESIFAMADKFPQYITVRGDGFLSALVKEKDYTVTHVSPALNEVLQDAQNLRQR
jgi:hypothetical protein